ncbi:ABC transporter ATP-binding protein [Natrononativus amylolyticus]|uniref:ABC transporter ATP-binding protein n=1 Tax=Natrononativus amylolyticus TaxID=2963434 RepID=UPI0020CDD2B4|nr:ABC transporter ATP-binding protein [Natrononativus amylolyticus]
MTLLDVNELSIEYRTDEQTIHAVNDVSFTLQEGEILCIVGESGCGKTTLAEALVGLLPSNGVVSGGNIMLDETDLAQLSESEYKDFRATEISYVIQSAMNALDPVYPIKKQFIEVIRTHTDLSKGEALERSEQMLENVGIDANRINDYPHELSGGQRQRVVIAFSLLLEPSIVVADEPTTGLDVVVQDDVLEMILDLQRSLNNSMIIITHDMSVVAEIADRVIVMYGGEIAEIGPVSEIFNHSAHPYTMGLNNAFPTLEVDVDQLISIPGSPPELLSEPSECQFMERCPFSTDECYTRPPLDTVDGTADHRAKCHYVEDRREFRDRAAHAETWEPEQ